LGDICHTVTKGTTPTSIGFDFSTTGIPFLRIQNLAGNTVSLNDVLYIDENTHAALKRSVIQPNDFLITIAGTIGKTAIVPSDFPECNCNQAIAILRFDKEKLLPNYLLYWLSTSDAFQQISGKKVTATISNLSLGQIKSLEIPLPPLPEQQRIAAILDKADAIRRKRQQAIQLADEFLRSVFLEMFGDPVTNPKGWDVQKLGTVAKKVTDGTHHSPPIVAVGVPYITAKHLKEYGLDFFANPWYISEKSHAEIFKRCSPGKGDVLYIKDGATTGIAGINHYDFEFSMLSSLALIKPNTNIFTSEYLVSIMNHPVMRKNILANIAGAAITRLTIAKIKDIPLPIPPIELQREFAQRVQKVEGLKAKLKASQAQAEAQFNALSQRAFAGELRRAGGEGS
jgi:type I restriction enzyme S subunit